MAVLHITYKRNQESRKADYEKFSEVLNSYTCMRLSESNWAITAEEPPKRVWRKLMRHIDPDEYLVMLPLDAKSWSSQDAKALTWVLSRP